VTRPDVDAGFTMIELLVVLVIMPIVIGAIAAAIIISEKDSGVASSRLSDSASAQTISEYYVRDVQGAEYITTNGGASSPTTVCGASSVPAQSTLVLGLYRPNTSSSNELSVAYWLSPVPNSQPQQYELVRYSCPSGATAPIQVPITSDITSSDDVTSVTTTCPSGQLNVCITPGEFNAAAAVGWTTTTTTTPPASVSSVTISLTEPGSSYTYSLQAFPRV
jgi:prepilin-type N-terminal cleavage/methylation domain-containing protein